MKKVITGASGLTALFLVGCTTNDNYRTDSTDGTESREVSYRDAPYSTRDMNRPSDVYSPSRDRADPHQAPSSATWPWQVQQAPAHAH